jgi:3-deoxy-D-manno-octulosonic-acid transferase
MPYDFLPCMLLAFWRIRPSKIFIIEAEIWPNLLILSSLFKIKKYLINARISNRSYGRYKFLKFIFAPLFNSFEKIYTQSRQDVERFKTLNIGQEQSQTKIEVLGDIKAFNVYQKWQLGQKQVTHTNILNETYARMVRYTHYVRTHHRLPAIAFGDGWERATKPLAISAEALRKNCVILNLFQDPWINKQSLFSPTLFVGSIHPGELDTYIKLYQELKPTHPNLKMILAPRHFHWTDELEAKIKQAGLTYFTWTDKNKINDTVTNDAVTQTLESHDILLVCKLGEMFNLYQFANIFYLGGTFVNIGGHNLLEPAVWSKACIIGPYHQNTQAIADQMQSIGGLIKVTDFEQLLQASQKLLSNPQLQEQMGECNFEWLQKQAAQIGAAIQEIIKIV